MTRELLVELGVDRVPVPVEFIARAKGLPIVESNMEAEVSGALIKSGNLRGIAINASNAPVRKRFTIAHELGHHLMNHIDKDHIDWEFTVIRRDGLSSEAQDDQEMAANSFAANLLMPKHQLRQDMERYRRFNGEIRMDEADVALLAKKYRVSTVAMNYRLQNLGFLSWA
ncbi:ImmA/IrrE family metallo-endopeptidase [Acidicapsa dinghuensis]|uniref:ImmA/IrrE family metallo-endopeptidase n=1 Tax=Acidicapsa dinghuensis TaxID=2218256 RepID=A0ABW1ELI5_9BACT|nr:ImmA/IrrE family metallo-endopeptidase [Acidicapsa dinghuensis]